MPQQSRFPIVGIGASAGGLAAFEAFFGGMPKDSDPGMAFVIVQHLDPDHKSILCELIRRYTRMSVFQVEDGMVVQQNCTYIIPPGRDMAFLNGSLQLLTPTKPRGQRLSIDFFFRSLALDQHERAIGIVLSGTGSDGTMGLRAIKGEGGMIMAQSTDTAEFTGMPESAIGTGLVDYVMPPTEMAVQLIRYTSHAFSEPLKTATNKDKKFENALSKIFILLRSNTSHDFSLYKPSTIIRRIDRRMAVNQIDAIDDYVLYLRQTPNEVEALFRDLLIGVTSFFRDPEAFEILEDQVIPKLFKGKPAGSSIRIWTPGCSTGEEAYSIAILLMEHVEALRQNYSVQVFATDIDSHAIATARSGIYPASMAANISPDRLARFFTTEEDGRVCRIHKSIRNLLIFSEHDLIKDPPFSKLDLISCRNLLIYMGPELQKNLIRLFHYALEPNGILFLGTSESIGDFDNLFALYDRKSKLFQRKEGMRDDQRVGFGRTFPSRSSFLSPIVSKAASVPHVSDSLRSTTERALLERIVAAAALVNAHGDILYLHGRTGIFLEPPPGESGVNNIFKMSREGLRRDLTTTFHKAAETKGVVDCRGLRVKTNSHFTTVNLAICPVTTGSGASPAAPFYLIVLEEAPPTASPTPPPGGAVGDDSASDVGSLVSPEARIASLKMELRANEEYLRTTIEELGTFGEELKSSNEEMQSINEELQSTNEELETSKEELHSLNEELATVNAELQVKVADLSRVNNDMNNLLAGTGIATVFVDHRLCILRFTPTANTIINLIPSDVGRPVGHIVSNLVGYTTLLEDVQAVLDTLVPKQTEVRTIAGKSYTLRVKPYRTLENAIEGAVISFSDITEHIRAEETLRAEVAELLRLAVVARDVHDAIAVQDLDGRILTWSPGAVRMYGWTEAEALEMNARDRIPDGVSEVPLTMRPHLSEGKDLEPFRTRRVTKEGKILDVSILATALTNEADQLYAIATTERAIQK